MLGARSGAPLPPEAVLEKYHTAISNVAHPRNVSFEFSVEQLGLRNMEQTHRIYRSGLDERDETLVVDGYHLKAPSVRIISNRTNRYEIDRVAPSINAYQFTFASAINESDAYGYFFTTQARGDTAYAITQIEVDGKTYLPRTVRFKIAGGGVHGSGILTYGPVGGYWVVLAAEVSAHLANGSIAHEALHWSNYSFPKSLPPSTFQVPGALAEPAPPVATPAPATPDAPAVP